MAFGRRLHPIGTAARMSADTMAKTRGRGIPTATIASWDRRGSDPTAKHLLTLGRTYGWALLSEVFVEVDVIEAEQAERELVVAQARLAALKLRGAR